MAFISAAPTPPLASYVARIWDCRLPPFGHFLERALPMPGAGLIINLAGDEVRICDEQQRCERLPGAVFEAPRTRSIIIDTAEQTAVTGVNFLPGGARAFAREPLDRLVERDWSLEDLFGTRSRRLRQRLLEARDAAQRLALLDGWLRARLADASQPDAAIVAALQTLAQAPSVHCIADIARDSGLSQRQFGQRFREQVGVGPKRYARLLRFRAVIDAVHGRRRVDWAAVAADCGFHDQPHLVREFSAFSGVTPTAHMSLDTEYADHVPLMPGSS
jgi:AraC-like DNA-binding protein